MSLPANAPSYTSKGIGVVVVEVVVVVVVVEVKATLQDWSAVSNAHFIVHQLYCWTSASVDVFVMLVQSVRHVPKSIRALNEW